jgi:1-deoxy-D-xylulose-5-phosphate reductoisomerase
MRNIVVLGSTGSIGKSCLSVVRENPSRFRVVGLAAGANLEVLSEQVREFSPLVVSIGDPAALDEFRRQAPSSLTVLGGDEGLREICALETSDVIVNGLVGALGLVPTVEAIKAGKQVALANKESIVLAGEIVMNLARQHGAVVIPVDSEHSGVHQCLSGRNGEIRRIILTASGGPFLNRTRGELEAVTPEDVMRHPVWRMGRRICADSATLLNKGFEVIEAKWLFGVDLARIGVVIHPQCVIHALVEFADGTTLAQISKPDMRTPILYALTFPERIASGVESCNLAEAGPLAFKEPDLEQFPCLRLAYAAARAGGVAGAQLNAADELAVRAFFEGRIEFTRIAWVLEESMTRLEWRPADTIESVLEADREARRVAGQVIAELA